RANLTGVLDPVHHDSRYNLVERDLVGDDRRRLAAELEGDARDPLAADAHDPLARRGTACEGHLVYVRVAHEVLTDLTARWQHTHDAFRKFGRLKRFCEHHRAYRPLGRWLQDHGAAGS